MRRKLKFGAGTPAFALASAMDSPCAQILAFLEEHKQAPGGENGYKVAIEALAELRRTAIKDTRPYTAVFCIPYAAKYDNAPDDRPMRDLGATWHVLSKRWETTVLLTCQQYANVDEFVFEGGLSWTDAMEIFGGCVVCDLLGLCDELGESLHERSGGIERAPPCLVSLHPK